MKVVISLFDLTGLMVEDYLRAGYTCFLFDGQHPAGCQRVRTRHPGRLFKVGMWFDVNNLADTVNQIVLTVNDRCPNGWTPRIVFGFPECTDLTCSGARWWAAKALLDPLFQAKAVDMFRLPERVAGMLFCPYMSENPAISALNTKYRKPDHVFDPYQYGGYLPEDDQHPLYSEIYPAQDAYPKSTGIWCSEGFNMPEFKPVESCGFNPGWQKLGGKSLRTKNIRSSTPRGFARAVYLANQ